MDTMLQQEVTDKIKTLSPDSLEFLLTLIDNYIAPASNKKMNVRRKIGIFKDQDLYDPDYDFDEMNDEIAEMFGVES